MPTDRSADMLVRIMTMQANFQTRTPDGVVSFKEANPERTAEMVRVQTLACIKELCEAMDEIGWKPWASAKFLNVEAFRSELIDALRFLLNLIHVAGLSPEGVLSYYEESLAKTQRRVDEGYTGLKKCPACKRAYDDDYTMCKERDDTNDPPTPAMCTTFGYVTTTGEPMQWSPVHMNWVLVDPA